MRKREASRTRRPMSAFYAARPRLFSRPRRHLPWPGLPARAKSGLAGPAWPCRPVSSTGLDTVWPEEPAPSEVAVLRTQGRRRHGAARQRSRPTSAVGRLPAACRSRLDHGAALHWSAARLALPSFPAPAEPLLQRLTHGWCALTAFAVRIGMTAHASANSPRSASMSPARIAPGLSSISPGKANGATRGCPAGAGPREVVEVQVLGGHMTLSPEFDFDRPPVALPSERDRTVIEAVREPPNPAGVRTSGRSLARRAAA